MRRIFWLALVLAVAVARPGFSWPVNYPTGTTLYDPEKAYDGYTLFSSYSKSLYLIDMSGQVVHEWKLKQRIIFGRLLPNGNLVVIAYDPHAEEGRPGIQPFKMGGAAGLLMELTWDGDVVFQHADLNMHHDALKLPNGNYLYLAWERVPPELQARVRGGVKHTEFHNLLRSKRNLSDEEFENLDRVMFNDVLVEITPQRQVVWDWHANEHLDPDVDIIGPVFPREEWCHANTINVLRDGNVLLTSRALDSMLVIDKQTRDVVFRWGNLTRLDKKSGELEMVQPSLSEMSRPSRTLSGPHGAEEVPPGCPGEGHFMCYDNSLFSIGPVRTSRAVEVDPKTGDVVWQSIKVENGMPLPVGRKQFSEIFGTAERLPNGNTLLCEGINGRLFQITKDLEEVWEYVSPYDEDKIFNGVVMRACCYPPDYCPQLQGLSPAKGAKAILAAVGRGEPVAGAPPVKNATKSMFENPGLAASLAALAVLTVLAVAVAFLIGRQRGRSEAVAVTPQSANNPTKRHGS